MLALARLGRQKQWSGARVMFRRRPCVPDILHALPRRDEETEEKPLCVQISHYHTSAPALYSETPAVANSGVAIVLGLGAVSAASFAAVSAVQAVRQWNDARAAAPSQEEAADTEVNQQEQETQKDQQAQNGQQEKAKQGTAGKGRRENIFAKWFDVGGRYYEGGFEDTMTRREAALILGVRESSTAQRIKEAHRKLLILNHPDTGGSTYISGKINEAKELLLKNKAK